MGQDVVPSAAPLPPPAASAGAAGASAPEAEPETTGLADHAQALLKLRAGQKKEALKLLRAAATKEPESALIATDLGYTLLQIGRFEEAETWFRKGIALDPKRYHAYVHLAETVAREPNRWEKRQDVLRLIDQGLVNVPKGEGHTKLALALARLHRALGLLKTAQANLEAMLREGGDAGVVLSSGQRKQALDLQSLIALEEKARTLEDWPEPQPDETSLRELSQAQAAIRDADNQRALSLLDGLLQRLPAWRAPRRLRADILSALGRYDEAVTDLGAITRLAPSDAESWRRLGLTLTEHGGTLAAVRADEALRHALALEPEWTDLERVRAELAMRASRARSAVEPPPLVPPTQNAKRLLERASELLETGEDDEQARKALEEALRDSPTFIAAAASLYALAGSIPPATIKALWNDGPRLFELAQQVRKLGGEKGRQLSEPWQARALELGVRQALFARAVSRAQKGDARGALADVTEYVAKESDPGHLEEAHALRATIGEEQPRTDPATSPLLLARSSLMEDRPEDALRILGTDCTPSQGGEKLVMLGMVNERLNRDEAAFGCLSTAIAVSRTGMVDSRVEERALRRLGRLAARTGDTLLGKLPASLISDSGRVTPAAHFALARQRRLLGDADGAARFVEQYLAVANPSDTFIDHARQMQSQLMAQKALTITKSRAKQRLWIGVAAACGLSTLLLLYLVFWKGRTLSRALRKRPAIYPEVARILGELRHDILKHRTSALGILVESPSLRQDVQRALMEPEPTSRAVARLYAELQSAARAHRTELRRLAREPIWGPLVRDLARVERCLASKGRDQEIADIDHRLRNLHAQRLASLLEQGPRIRVDAAELQRFIGSVEAERRQSKQPWVAPALQLGELSVEFPVERKALTQIFVNLLRNAEQAVGADGKVLISIAQQRDVTGQKQVEMVVFDSSPQSLTLDAIEARESGRGLALIRDLTRRWRGHVVLRSGQPPYTKAMGACFPL